MVLTAYLVWKFVKKTKVVPLRDIPLKAALDQADQQPEEPEPKQNGWLSIVSWIWT